MQIMCPPIHRHLPASAVILLIVAIEILAQSTKPAALPAPASAPREPRYTRSLPVPEDMIRRRPRQVIALPSEPGEVGEDPLQLSSGVLGKVSPDVHRLPEGYVIAGAQASIEQRADWLVCNVPDQRSVALDLKDAAGWAADLDARRIPAGLNRACQDKGLQISTETTVVVEEPGRTWRLADPRRNLFIQKDPGAVMVRVALPVRALPNKTLMMLEAALGNAAGSTGFGITGRVTEFQGNNYILLEHVTELAAAPAGAPDTAPKLSASQPAVNGGAASAPAGREPRAEDIIKQLLENKPRRALVLPKTLPAVSENKPGGPIAEGRPDQLTWPEETMIVERPGRMVQGDKLWTFSFEDRGLTPGHKPIRLLPNRMLENAIALGGDKSMGVVLVVSGEITEYRGVNYLLLRKVLVQRDMGNFR